MQDFQRKPALSGHLLVMYLVAAIIVGFIWYFQWMLGLVMTAILAVSIYYSVRTERKLQNETQKYIETLSHRVKRVGEEALLEMPIGIILFNDEYMIEWANPYMNRFAEEEDSLVGMSLNVLSDDLASRIKKVTTKSGWSWMAINFRYR